MTKSRALGISNRSTEAYAVIANLRAILIATWLGAALLFTVVVAPAAFSVLRSFQLSNSSEIAGAIVNRALFVVNTSGFVVALLLLLTIVAIRKTYSRWLFQVELLSLLVMAVATSIGQWVIGARMQALRAGLSVPIDQLPVEDARRMAFSILHGYSVAALSAAMIAALLLIVIRLYHSNR